MNDSLQGKEKIDRLKLLIHQSVLLSSTTGSRTTNNLNQQISNKNDFSFLLKQK